MLADTQRYPIRFTGPNRAMVALGLTRRWSYVDVGATQVSIRMSWAFHAVVDRASLTSVTADTGSVWHWGVHGWRGQWVINGSSSGLVRLELDPPGRGRLLGVLPVALRIVRVAVEQPDQLVAALSPSPPVDG